MEFNQYRILIVDDNPSFIIAFDVLLKNVLGTKLDFIDSATNGIEALEKVNNNSYNFIFMDVNMPQMNGIIATKLINRKSNRFTKIIAISFNSDFQTVADMLNSGASGYINKANLTYDEVVKIFASN